MSFGILGALGGRRLHDGRVRDTSRTGSIRRYNAYASDLGHHQPQIADGFLNFVLGSIQPGALLLSNESGAELAAELLMVLRRPELAE
jgi:hypothetical protein